MFVRTQGVVGKLLLAGLAVAAGGSTARAQVPKGWYAAGIHPKEYEMTVDRATKHGGSASATIRYKEDDPATGFGTLMQTFKADEFRGKRRRLTGYVKEFQGEPEAPAEEAEKPWFRVVNDPQAGGLGNRRHLPIRPASRAPERASPNG